MIPEWLEETIEVAKEASGRLKKYQEILYANMERYLKLVKETKMSCEWKKECDICPLASADGHNHDWYCGSKYNICPYEEPKRVAWAACDRDDGVLELFTSESLADSYINRLCNFDPESKSNYCIRKWKINWKLPATREEAIESARKKLNEEELELLGLK